MNKAKRLLSEDRYFTLLIAIAVILSVIAYVVVLRSGHLLAYADSLSHLMISRRVISSPTPGFSQLGGVWPPAPHVLILPVVWIDWMYTSGSAGSIISMASYVATISFIYKICTSLGVRNWGAFGAALLVATNPNMLHMQATSMTELPLLLVITAAVYSLIRWCQSQSVFWLVCTIAAVTFGTATRYEAWAMLVVILAVILWVAIVRRIGPMHSFDLFVYFGFFSSTFIVGWAVWNKLIIQSGWLGFLDSEYASASLWVANNEPSRGNPWVALQTYFYAIRHISGIWLIAMAGVGVVVFLLRSRLRPDSVGALTLLFPFPFFVLTLTLGQRPLHVPEISDATYNVRFALQMMPALGVFGAYMVDSLISLASPSVRLCRESWVRRFGSLLQSKPGLVALGVGFMVVGVTIAPTYIVTLDEPIAAAVFSEDQYEVSSWIHEHYPGYGTVLMETPGNEIALFHSGIDLGDVIYEGTNQDDVWEDALKEPDAFVDWVVMRTTPGAQDKVALAMINQPHALDGYVLVYQSTSYDVYVRATTASQLGLPVPPVVQLNQD